MVLSKPSASGTFGSHSSSFFVGAALLDRFAERVCRRSHRVASHVCSGPSNGCVGRGQGSRHNPPSDTGSGPDGLSSTRQRSAAGVVCEGFREYPDTTGLRRRSSSASHRLPQKRRRARDIGGTTMPDTGPQALSTATSAVQSLERSALGSRCTAASPRQASRSNPGREKAENFTLPLRNGEPHT